MELTQIELNHLLSLLHQQKDSISVELIKKISTHYVLEEKLAPQVNPENQMKQLRIELSELMRNMRKFDPNSPEGHQMGEKAELLIASITEVEQQLQQNK
jgi:CII-binding regulator of phage lambda lysogenization HflD